MKKLISCCESLLYNALSVHLSKIEHRGGEESATTPELIQSVKSVVFDEQMNFGSDEEEN